MKKRTELLIHGIAENKKKRQRRLALLTALAMLTGGNVYWELREIGMALDDETVAESDVSADIETPEIWELSFPENTGNSRQEQAVLIAESQLGYTESEQNFITDENGEIHGYTRYGEWYGNPCGEWNTMFVYFCMYYAGISAEEIPCGGNAHTWQVSLDENNLLLPPDTVPECGDVILLDCDEDGDADRTGIITDTENLLTVIEGDCENTVAEVQYEPDDMRILGFVKFPDSDMQTDITEELPETDTQKQIFNAQSQTGIQVCASAEEGTFPNGTVMRVKDIPRDEALKTAAETLGTDEDSLDAVAVDISFFSEEGKEIEPDGFVGVQITLPETYQLDDGKFAMLHLSDDGKAETVDAELIQDTAYFSAECFSVYIWTSYNNDSNPNIVVTENDYIDITTALQGNSASNPYVIEVGETIFVKTISTSEDIVSGGYRSAISVEGNDFTENGVNLKHIDRFKEQYDNITENQDGTYTAYAYFIGSNAGDCKIFARRANGANEYLYVKVVEPTIYVRTALGDIPKNRVHEYLARTYHSADDKYIYTIDNSGNIVPLYIKNTATNGGRYLIYEGESVVLVGKDTSKTFTTDSQNIEISQSVGSVVATITTKDITGNVPATINFGDEKFELYIRSQNDTQTCDHADIEISDGGTYVITKTDANNITVITYEAIVSNVNHCYIYDSSNNILESFFPEDYLPNGELGVTQYELTSQGINHGKSIDRRQADHAEFDISIYFKPISKTVNGTAESIEGEESITAESIVFQLDKRSVIDAFNKCPDHTGFDFTLKANLNELITIAPTKAAAQATKNYTNGTLQDGQFTFELHRVEYSLQKSTQVGNEWQINLNDCFPAVNSTHTYRAYQINDLEGYGSWGSGIIDNSDAYTNALNDVQSGLSWGEPIGRLLERYKNGNTAQNDMSIDTFYTITSKYLVQSEAVSPDENGIFHVQNGFCIIVDEGETVATAKNDSNGNVQFDEYVYLAKGTYHYLIREQVNQNDTANAYDEHYEPVTVTVTESNNSLSAVVSYDPNNAVFSNLLFMYVLPSTGGIGVLPCYLGGTALVAVSAIMFIKKRKEEI